VYRSHFENGHDSLSASIRPSVLKLFLLAPLPLASLRSSSQVSATPYSSPTSPKAHGAWNKAIGAKSLSIKIPQTQSPSGDKFVRVGREKPLLPRSEDILKNASYKMPSTVRYPQRFLRSLLFYVFNSPCSVKRFLFVLLSK